MSARFHLYLSGVLDRSRSCAETVSVSVASAAALTTRPIQRRLLRVSMSVAALLLAVAEHRQGAVAMVRVRVLCMLSILASELIAPTTVRTSRSASGWATAGVTALAVIVLNGAQRVRAISDLHCLAAGDLGHARRTDPARGGVGGVPGRN